MSESGTGMKDAVLTVSGFGDKITSHRAEPFRLHSLVRRKADLLPRTDQMSLAACQIPCR
jgi:hypothetical protein